ncbi:MAG TPA: DUF58 domain-containing protein [Anaerolineae bacterium]|nr:DUF58 domain-containing protein [Anaerolineae bacterium]
MNHNNPTIKMNSWLLPSLAIVTLITDVLTPYKGWRILTVALAGAWLVSYLWVRSLAKGLELLREMRFGWAQVGDRLVERFTLRNEGWAPAVWAEIRDQSTMPNYQVSRGTGLPGHDSIRWHTEAICTRRGLFTLGPTQVLSGDPFGLFSLSFDYTATMPLLVLPPIVPLPAIEVAPGGRSGDGRPRPNAPDRTVSASTVREYVSGDSRRWIHWKTVARRNELYVRVFDGTPSSDWWIVLDVDRNVQAGEGENSTLEHGVILAASLGDRGLRMRHAVGLVAHSEHLVWLHPQTGEGHRWEVLRSLALVTMGASPLGELLARVSTSIGQRASLVLITAAMDPAWVGGLVPLIRRGVVPTVLLLDPESFGGPGKVETVAGMLTGMGVANYCITRDVLDRPELRPGRQGHWGWRSTGTGRVVPTRKIADSPWQVLE